MDASRRRALALVASTPAVAAAATVTRPGEAVAQTVGCAQCLQAAQAGTTAGGTPLRAMTLQPAPAGKAPFTLELGGARFGSPGDPRHEDSVMYFGYNAASGGTKVVASEPILCFNIESQFFDGGDDGADTAEAYIEFHDTTGNFITRPIMFNFRRTPGSVNDIMRQSIFRGHPILFQLPDMQTGIALLDEGSFLLNGTPASPSCVLELDAAAGGSPQLVLRQNGVQAFALTAHNLNIATMAVQGQTVLTLSCFGYGQQVAIGGPISNGVMTADLRAMTAGGLYAFQSKLPANPAGNWNHQTWETGGAVQSRVNRLGYFMTRARTAPADTDLASSEVAFWLDDTVGATRAMFKAKDSSGTVRTGSVPLN